MKKGVLLALPLLLICPLLLLMLGMGNASMEAVRAACATPPHSSTINPTTGGAFRIGTLNWRGASHYARNPHPGERPYGERVPNMVAKIGASAASIIGFQEFEPPQAQAFLTATDGAWEIVPGRRRGKPSTADAIAYQPGTWTLDEVRYVSIKYGDPLIQVPLARFTSTGNSGSIWVLNTHHPSDAVGGTDAMRDAGIRTEARALQELQEAEPHTPLLLTGDMNDRARFKHLFLTVTDGWSTANPSDEQIDWIMGGPAVTFAGTVVDHSTNDQAHSYTDHPFVHTTAQLATPTPERAAAPEDTADLEVLPTNITATPDGSGHGSGVASEADTGCTTSTTTTASTLTLATELTAGLSTGLEVRVDAMLRTPHGLCGLSWTAGAPCTYKNQCPKVVDALYGGPGVGRGLGDGEDVAQGIIDAGLAQSHGTGLDPLPPAGAVVSYDTGNGVGHVAIYVGEGTIFGNDYGCSASGVYGCVGFADVHTPGGSVTWAQPVAAFDLGGTPTALGRIQ